MKTEEHLMSRFATLKEQRQPFEAIWDKAALMCSADVGIYEKDRRRDMYVQKVFDSTARNALTYFTSSLKSILVPTTEQWHRLRPSQPLLEESYEVKSYLQKITDLLFKVRYSPYSQFASETDIMLSQIGIYGIGVFYLEDNIGKGISYKCIPIDEVYIDQDRLGVTDTVYREYELTLSQAYETFGDKLSEDLKRALDITPDKKVKFLHAVEPRKNRNVKAKDYTSMKYVSYHVELDTKKIVKEGGYRTMPYMIPHYLKLSNSAYGDSPAQQCFADMLMINEMQKTLIRTAQLQANPAILTSNSLMDSSKIGRAGGIIRGGLDSQGRPLAVPMQYANDLTVSLEMIESTRLKIEVAFLKPLFQALTQEKEMTATEVEKREMEKSMLLAPMCERISSEWLSPMIERELDILSQYGFLDDVPDDLMEDGSISIEIESPYVRMQDSQRIMGLYKTAESAMTLAQVDPTSLDIFDTHAAIREIADYYDVATNVIRSPEVVQSMGEQRAQQEQATAFAEQAETITKSMKNLGIKARLDNVPNP